MDIEVSLQYFVWLLFSALSSGLIFFHEELGRITMPYHASADTPGWLIKYFGFLLLVVQTALFVYVFIKLGIITGIAFIAIWGMISLIVFLISCVVGE